MIILNLKDGSVQKYDPSHPDQLKELNRLGRSPSFISSLRAANINLDKQSHSLPFPKKFKRVVLSAEILVDNKEEVIRAEKISFHGDETVISLTVYKGNRPIKSRVDVERVGKIRWQP